MKEKKIFGRIDILSKNQRIDKFLSKKILGYSRSLIKTFINNGLVKINKKTIFKPDKKVLGGEIFSLKIPEKKENNKPQNIVLDVVYEDDSLIIINKQANLVVHPGAGNLDGTMLNALLYHFPGIENVPRAGIVHRLDKNTSGLIIVAKNSSIQKSLINLIKNREVIRKYKSIVNGLTLKRGTINQPISRNALNRKLMSINLNGKPSITCFKTIKNFRFHSLIKINLKTGRMHQIRVHMLHIDHPVIGDNIYYKKKKLLTSNKKISKRLNKELKNFNRQALHAYLLKFRHPLKNHLISLKSKLPKDMEKLILALEYDKKKFT